MVRCLPWRMPQKAYPKKGTVPLSPMGLAHFSDTHMQASAQAAVKIRPVRTSCPMTLRGWSDTFDTGRRVYGNLRLNAFRHWQAKCKCGYQVGVPALAG